MAKNAEKKDRVKRSRLERMIAQIQSLSVRANDHVTWASEKKAPTEHIVEMRKLVDALGKGTAAVAALARSGWKPPTAAHNLAKGDAVTIAKEHSKLYGYIRSVAEGKAETMVVTSVVDAGRGSRLLIGSQDGKQSYGYIPQAHLVRA
jgi:hypothetical protein